jgi:hypothetical protein
MPKSYKIQLFPSNLCNTCSKTKPRQEPIIRQQTKKQETKNIQDTRAFKQ